MSTATLAWGVNLPAHMVIIKGTQVSGLINSGHRALDAAECHTPGTAIELANCGARQPWTAGK